MTYAQPDRGPNSPYTADVVAPAVNPVPAQRPDPRPPRVGRTLGALVLGGVVLMVGAFALAGVLMTVGLIVIPLVVVAAIAYLAYSARADAPRREAPRQDPHDSVPSKSGVRGGSAQ